MDPNLAGNNLPQVPYPLPQVQVPVSAPQASSQLVPQATSQAYSQPQSYTPYNMPSKPVYNMPSNQVYNMPQASAWAPAAAAPPQPPIQSLEAVGIHIYNPKVECGQPQLPPGYYPPMMQPQQPMPQPIYYQPQMPAGYYPPMMQPQQLAPAAVIPAPAQPQVLPPPPSAIEQQSVPSQAPPVDQQPAPVPPQTPPVDQQPAPEQQKPAAEPVNVEELNAALKSENLEEQAQAMQKIAEVAQSDQAPQLLTSEETFNDTVQSLADIANNDTSKVKDEALKKQGNEVKEMSIYTLAMLQKNYRDSKGGAVPFEELPGMRAIAINALKTDPSPSVRKAAISAMLYIATPQDIDPITTLLTKVVEAKKEDPEVKDTAEKGLAVLQQVQQPQQ